MFLLSLNARLLTTIVGLASVAWYLRVAAITRSAISVKLILDHRLNRSTDTPPTNVRINVAMIITPATRAREATT